MQSSNPLAGPHLDPERLAAFDDGAGDDVALTADERAHLAACAPCRAERDALVALVAMAGALGRDVPSATAPRLVEFDAILAGLRAGDEAGTAPATMTVASASSPTVGAEPRRVRPRLAPVLRRAAAVLLLVGGGAVFGRLSGGSGFAPGARTVAPAAPAAFADRPFTDASYASVEQATIALNEAQHAYERASLWLAANDTTARDPEVFRARLAALDQMMEASRVALRDAPQDPVLNHYYLAAYSAREATLQALSSALPVDKIIERY